MSELRSAAYERGQQSVIGTTTERPVFKSFVSETARSDPKRLSTEAIEEIRKRDTVDALRWEVASVRAALRHLDKNVDPEAYLPYDVEDDWYGKIPHKEDAALVVHAQKDRADLLAHISAIEADHELARVRWSKDEDVLIDHLHDSDAKLAAALKSSDE